MRQNADPDLRAYVVWVPKAGGREKHVPAATAYVPDPRARHYWDGVKTLVNGYNSTLSLSQDAWDMYLIYGPAARWEGPQPPPPDYWMHQLDFDSAPELDAAVFAAKVKTLTTR